MYELQIRIEDLMLSVVLSGRSLWYFRQFNGRMHGPQK